MVFFGSAGTIAVRIAGLQGTYEYLADRIFVFLI